jgi:hypothetical protein
MKESKTIMPLDFTEFDKQMREAGIDKKKIELPEEWSLCCPNCNNAYGLHHDKITIWNRRKEDHDGVRFTIKGTSLTSKLIDGGDSLGGPKENPSKRRDGLVIEFWCEHCPEIKPINLRIAQHKGITLMGWMFYSKKHDHWFTRGIYFDE